MKIALGTVQFGMLYGIANKNGQVAKKSVRKILSHAKKNGINTVDTAISYGDSEEFLGNAGIKEWDLVTKLPEVPKLCTNISDWVNDQITGSLKRLRVDRVKALMLHRPEQLLGTDGGDLWHAIKELKNRGIVKKIGFSIYGPEELEQLWMRYRPDIIQAPFNIFDQRLKTSGWLEKLHNNNVEIHVRSIFLPLLGGARRRLLLDEHHFPHLLCPQVVQYVSHQVFLPLRYDRLHERGLECCRLRQSGSHTWL